jgi:hypothetical protein
VLPAFSGPVEQSLHVAYPLRYSRTWGDAWGNRVAIDGHLQFVVRQSNAAHPKMALQIDGI